MSSSSQNWLSTASQLAREAGAAVMTLHKQPMTTERKADQSLVTEADLKADEIIKTGLQKNCPEHAILTEESGLIGKNDSDYIWLIDPLDGTKAYAKGIPGFSIMLGLLKNGVPELGVVYDPLEDRLYEAIRGQGTFHTHKEKRNSLQISKRSDFSEMPLILSPGFPETALKTLKEKLKSPQAELINSVGIKVGLLVRQIGDLYLNHHSVHLWDTCAPQIILEEAGGVFTKIDGSSLDYTTLKAPYSHHSLTLASNGLRHEEMVKLMKEWELFG